MQWGGGASVNDAKCVSLHFMEGYFGVTMRCILHLDEEGRYEEE